MVGDGGIAGFKRQGQRTVGYFEGSRWAHAEAIGGDEDFVGWGEDKLGCEGGAGDVGEVAGDGGSEEGRSPKSKVQGPKSEQEGVKRETENVRGVHFRQKDG